MARYFALACVVAVGHGMPSSMRLSMAANQENARRDRTFMSAGAQLSIPPDVEAASRVSFCKDEPVIGSGGGRAGAWCMCLWYRWRKVVMMCLWARGLPA